MATKFCYSNIVFRQYAVPTFLNFFDKGGLNISSLKAFNLALLQKWHWRLLSSPNALWIQVIKAYHEVLIQMVVASRAFGLTLLEPPIFSTRK
ncbi:hypothetical protein Tco_0252999, partial [Tanacetum coccineum]